MDVNHRIVFSVKENPRIVDFLNKNGIKYKYEHSAIYNIHSDFVIVNILESHKAWLEMHNYISHNEHGTIISSAVYSKKEMAEAEWFTCRSTWRWEYPQPQSDKFGYMKNITYEFSSNCRECGYGKKQIGNFRVRKSPSWGKKNFLMLNWEEDVLFLSDRAKEILSASDLKGFKFLDVLNTKGTQKIEDINQLVIESCTQPGLVWQGNDTIKEINSCTACGITKYICAGRGHVYKRESLPDNVDFAKSIEGFGCGTASSSLIFVSKKFYDLIVENDLESKLEFEPLMLV